MTQKRGGPGAAGKHQLGGWSAQGKKGDSLNWRVARPRAAMQTDT